VDGCKYQKFTDGGGGQDRDESPCLHLGTNLSTFSGVHDGVWIILIITEVLELHGGTVGTLPNPDKALVI
jgi:hypothetical protein